MTEIEAVKRTGQADVLTTMAKSVEGAVIVAIGEPLPEEDLDAEVQEIQRVLFEKAHRLRHIAIAVAARDRRS